MRPVEEAPSVRAARFADDAAAEESVGVGMRAARNADDEVQSAEAAQAAKDRRDLVKDILESSKDAVEAVLDAQDATSGELDSNEVPALDYAEWVRHAQRLKRIDAIARAGEPENAARLKQKEVHRHELFLARLYNRVGSEP